MINFSLPITFHQKDENIMSCTRLYVDPTETLTSQGRKMILVINGQSCRYCSIVLVFLKFHSPLPSTNRCVLD